MPLHKDTLVIVRNTGDLQSRVTWVKAKGHSAADEAGGLISTSNCIFSVCYIDNLVLIDTVMLYLDSPFNSNVN